MSKGGGYKAPVNPQQAPRREQVVKFKDNMNSTVYLRAYDVVGVSVNHDGTARHIAVGGMTIKVQETLPEIFRKLGWEQSL